ncbi:MAG: DUF3558 family protein, partial [Chloroflexales bacterium]|nr:DUF3558 family protein [Chloroflexales bacterium]
ARLALCALLFAYALAACGGPTPTASTAPYDNVAAPTSAAASSDAIGLGIDQTRLDVCALLPRAEVEAAIGTLVDEPKQSLAIGDEVGCGYLVDQGRGYEVLVYNLDRWELLPQFLDVSPVAGLGDGAYAEKRVGGGVTLYVLLRERAVVSVGVNGADTPQLRQLLSLALAQIAAV